MYIIIIILLFAKFSCVVYGLEECDDKADLRLNKGQIVKLRAHGSGWMSISACRDIDGERVPFDPVRDMENITHVAVYKIEWPTLPETQLETVQLFNVTSHGVWGACAHLRRLFISGGNYTMTLPDWLKNCTQLRDIGISYMELVQIRAILDRADQVTNVEINNVKDLGHIVRYPLFTKSMVSIKAINFWHHSNNAVLNEVNVTWSDVSSALMLQLSSLTRLENLIINLKNFDMCLQGNYPSVTLGSLQRLELEDTNTTRVCFRRYRAIPRLKYLQIDTFLLFVNIEFGELSSLAGPHNLTVKGNNFDKLSLKFTRANYLDISNLTNTGNVRIEGKIIVDCNKFRSEAFWLARAMRMGFVNAPDLFCTNGYKLENLYFERLECERVPCEGGCVCCRAAGPAGDAVVADCRDAGLRALPAALLRLPNLTELLAPNNTIAHIPDTLPDTLLRIDLSGNGVHTSSNEMSALLAVPARRVRLGGNSLECSCDNQPLLDAVLNGNEKIEDIEDVECLGEPETLLGLPGLCKSRELNTSLAEEKQNKEYEVKLANERQAVLIIMVEMTIALAIAALVLGAALYYRRTIKIILFARGWCLCWLRDDDVNENRRYDVFLSFCHEDAELVLDQLLPNLDQDYSVCVHLRDWIPGDSIPSQIRRSVEESKRTLVVVSKNFAESLWGLLEFKTAYANGLDERRIRVVMVVLDDVLESPDLNKDLREYVRYNTYVRWGDPWFWSKLRYALPHQTASPHLSPQVNEHVRYTVQSPESVSPLPDDTAV